MHLYPFLYKKRVNRFPSSASALTYGLLKPFYLFLYPPILHTCLTGLVNIRVDLLVCLHQSLEQYFWFYCIIISLQADHNQLLLSAVTLCSAINMPSSLVTGHKFGSEQLIPAGFMNPTMWPWSGMIPPPWPQQSVPAQQFAYPMPFPVVMPHQLNAQHHQQWYTPTPMENFASLPPKAKRDNENNSSTPAPVKLTRRHSDPGPIADVKQSNGKQPDRDRMWSSSSPVEEDFDYSETQLFAGMILISNKLSAASIYKSFYPASKQKKRAGIGFSAAYCMSLEQHEI